MVHLYDVFAKIAVCHKDKDILHLFSCFANSLCMEERNYVFEHFELFIKTAEAAREAPGDVVEMFASK